MDAVTRHVMRMIDEDTFPTGDDHALAIPHKDADALLERVEHPIGDVTGKVPGPGKTGGMMRKVETDIEPQDQPRDPKFEAAHGMDSEKLLMYAPNAMGRMARFKP